MTSKNRTLALAAFAALALTLTACGGTTGPASPPIDDENTVESIEGECRADEGVTVVVDAGDLDVAGDPSGTWCVLAEEPIVAADAVALAGITTEGTADYPDAIVCRVDGIPSADTDLAGADGTVVRETCESTPAAFAYWSLWVKPAGGDWGYAEEGLTTLELEPGEALELLFVLNNEPAAPAA